MPSFNQLADIRKNVQGKRLKKPAKWLFPHNAERQYRRLLNKLVRELTLAVRERLVPAYPEMLAEVEASFPTNDMLKTDDFLDRLRGIMLSIQEFITPKVKETITEMELIATEISNFNQEQFQKVNRSVFGIDIFVDQPYLRDQLDLFARQNAQLITSIPEQDLIQVSGIVERGLQEGTRFTEVARDIQKRFGITRRRANLISRDQTTKLNSSLTKLRQESAGITEYIWQTAGDERVRPTHRANDGKKFKWDNPPRETGHPGTDINCFKGDSKLFCFDFAKKIFRRRYSGKFSKLVTDTGCIIESTPNHPIYTSRGWLPFKLVQKGDYLIETSNNTLESFKMNPNNLVSSIEDCFHSILKFFGMSTSKATFGKFHGDISNSEIDIIELTSGLPCMFNSIELKEFAKFILTLSNVDIIKFRLPDFSSFKPQFSCLIATSPNFISGFCNLLSILSGTIFKPNDISLGTTSEFDSIFSQPLFYGSSSDFVSLRELINASACGVKSNHFINRQIFEVVRLSSESIGLSINPPSSHMIGDNIRIDAQNLSNGCNVLPFFKKGNCVIDNRVTNFSGHVYNLETSCNYYTKLDEKCKPILHNCRCVAIPVMEGVIE